FFFFQAEDGIRDRNVTGVQTCALPISPSIDRMITEAQNTRRRWRPTALWITGLCCALWTLQATSVEPTAATGFRTALPGYTYRFPFDHGSHDDFQTEWWYYTGHLQAADGRTFGYQLTFFRRAVAHEAVSKNPSRWALRHLYLAHFAVTDETGRRFQFMEKISRAGIRKAGAETGRLAVWIDEWRAGADGDSHVLRAQGEGIAIHLRLSPEKPPVIHGNAGLSRASDKRRDHGRCARPLAISPEQGALSGTLASHCPVRPRGRRDRSDSPGPGTPDAPEHASHLLGGQRDRDGRAGGPAGQGPG